MWSVLVCLLVILVTCLALLDARKPKNFPPGPKWLPIIGCALEMGKLHKKFGTLAKVSSELKRKYGPLVGLRIGRRNVVMINGFKEMQELLSRNELNGRPNDAYATSRTWGKRLGIIFNDSEELKEQRTFVLHQFRRYGFRKQDLDENISNTVRAFIDEVKERIEEDCCVSLDKIVASHIAKSIWHLLSEGNITLTKIEVESFLNAMKNFSEKISFVGELFNYMPFLINICPDFSGYTTYVNIHNRITTFVKEKIKLCKETYNQEQSYGLIDEYFNTLGSSKRKTSFSEDQLVAIILDLLIGGFGTTFSAISIALLYLVIHPTVQQKAQEEIDRVVGRDRLPNLEDKSQLQYVDCVVLETFRILTGRSLALARRTLGDVTFNGYFIPKDTILLGNFRDILLSEDEGWENPKEFVPERHLKDGRVFANETFIPFGLGKRKCLGEPLARSTVFLIVAGVLHQFNLETVPNSPPSTEFLEGFVPCVKPFKVNVTLR